MGAIGDAGDPIVASALRLGFVQGDKMNDKKPATDRDSKKLTLSKQTLVNLRVRTNIRTGGLSLASCPAFSEQPTLTRSCAR